jgi:biopolymer transport protein ExbD
MAEVNTGSDEKPKKGKPKKLHLRVDFTPMVDMNMLLITFFMFCTTLSKPQMMNLIVPAKDKPPGVEAPQVDKKRTITLLLGEKNVIYYYLGKLEENTTLMKTDYSPEGLRDILVKRNGEVVKKVAELRRERSLGKITEDTLKARVSRVRDAKDPRTGLYKGQIVIIKPMDVSTYENLVNVLDEMQICSIGVYAIVDLTEGDKLLLDTYLQNR